MSKAYKRHITIISIVTFFVLLVAYYFYHQNTQLIASDNCSMFPILLDFLNGNYLMENWVVGTASFAFTDTIWCLPGLLLGIHVPKIMSLCGALFHAALVSVLLYMLLRDEGERGNVKSTRIAVAITTIYLMLIAVVPYSGYTIENPTYLYLNLNLHAGAFMFMAIEMLLLFLWWKSDYKKKIYPILFTIYGILGQMSDSTPLMLFFGPLCVYAAYFLIWPKVEKNNKKNIFLIADSIFIVVVSACINKLIASIGGLTVLGTEFGFNKPDETISYVKVLAIKLLNLLGFDVKYGISFNPYLVIVCLIILLLAASVIYQLVLAIRSKPDKLGLLLALGIVSNVVGVLFIASGYDTVSARHIMAIPFFGAVLVAKMLFAISRKEKKMFTCALAAVLVISLGYGAYNLIKIKDLPSYGDDGEAVAEYIAQRGGETGYGALWVYTTISAYTDFETTLVPIRWDGLGNGFYKYNLLINTTWYDENDIHYIVLLSNEGDLYADGGNRTDFLKFAGEPDEDVVFGIYEVMYYEENLAQYCIRTE